MPDTRFCLLSVVFIAIITLRRKGCKRAAEVGISEGCKRAVGRQDWLRPSCALPRGRCQAEKPRPDEGALSFFCWRPFASGLAWTPIKKRLRLTSQPFLGLAERTRFELAVELPLRQFSKLLVSATHPPLRKHAESIFSIATAKVVLFLIPASVLAEIFSKNT